MNWQPIETAPKGMDVLVYNPVVGAYRSRYTSDNDWPCGFWGYLGTWFPQPTHWAQLPVPEECA